MPSTTEQFFALIRLATGTATAFPFQPTADEWRQLAEMAARHALTGVLFDGIERLQREQLPPRDVLLRWYAQREQIIRHSRTMESEAVALADLLHRHGMPAVLLKGSAVARLYPNPLARTSGDIDMWVPVERRRLIAFVRAQTGEAEWLYHQIKFPYKDGIPVELHFTPSWMFNPCLNRRLQRFFREQIPAQTANVQPLSGGGRLAVTTDGFNRVYILLHIFRHLFGEGIGLRQLMDYAFVLRQPCTPDERQTALATLRRLRLTRFAAAVMYVEQEVFGLKPEHLLLPPSESDGKFLLDEILRAGNFGKYDPRNRHADDEGLFARFFRLTRRNLRFVGSYPSEALSTPLFKAGHFLWRRTYRE